jgi:hypothetical protein
MKHTLTVNREVSVVKIAPLRQIKKRKIGLSAITCHIRHGFDEVAFGDALKRTVNEVFPWAVGPSKPRALLQQFRPTHAVRLIRLSLDKTCRAQAINGKIDFRVSTGRRGYRNRAYGCPPAKRG